MQIKVAQFRNILAWVLRRNPPKLRVASGLNVFTEIDNFTVDGLVTWALNGSKAGVDLVLIQASLLLFCKSTCYYAN